MSKYKLFSSKLVNMLIPPSQRGRWNILWLQSILAPLQITNDEFQEFTREKIIEANVSSQVMHFMWYLNYRFRKYFVNQKEEIKISHFVDMGVPVFNNLELGEVPNTIFSTSEDWAGTPLLEQPIPIFFEFESLDAIGASFKLSIPNINISIIDFDILLRAEVEKYRVSGKTYAIEHT